MKKSPDEVLAQRNKARDEMQAALKDLTLTDQTWFANWFEKMERDMKTQPNLSRNAVLLIGKLDIMALNVLSDQKKGR